jgi:hypothetical protein
MFCLLPQCSHLRLRVHLRGVYRSTGIIFGRQIFGCMFCSKRGGSSNTKDSREDRATQQTCSMGRRQSKGCFSGDHHGTVSHEALIFWRVWARGPWRARNIRGRHLKERAQTRTSGVGLRGSETDAQQQQALEQRVCRPLFLGPAEASHRDVGAEKALCDRQAHHQPVRSISVASDVRAGRRFVPVSFPFSSRDPQCDTLVLESSPSAAVKRPGSRPKYLGTSLFWLTF